MSKIVIGLDGAHWELLNPWLEAGILPNIAKIREEGVWGDLQSCLPPVTAPNWKCYSTGKNPGKLGVYWWEIVDVENREIRSPRSYDYHSPELWDYLDRGGRSAVVVNMPTTFPPRKTAMAVIAGGPDAEDTGYTYPSNLESDLQERFDYRVRPEKTIRDSRNTEEATVQSYLDVIDSRFEVAEWLLETKSPDFLHVTSFYINVLQHFFWDGEPTRRAWKLIDYRIGELLDAGHDLVLMSDHGSTEISWEINLNLWLEREGYLSVNDAGSHILPRLGITRERTNRLIEGIPYRDTILDLIPTSIKNNVPNEDGTLPKSTKNDLINWEASQALASGQGPIYLLPNGVNQPEELTEEITTRLESLRDPNGDEVFERVHSGEDLYRGPFTHLAPDLVIEQRPGYHVPGNVGGKSVFTRPKRWAGENKKLGLFAAYGDGIGESGPFKESAGMHFSILDLLPTILHWVGETIPTDADGEVRYEIFADGSEPSARDAEFIAPMSQDNIKKVHEGETVEGRLENLGYL